MPMLRALSRGEWSVIDPSPAQASLSIVDPGEDFLGHASGWGLFLRLRFNDISDGPLPQRLGWNWCTTAARQSRMESLTRGSPSFRFIVPPTPWHAVQVLSFARQARDYSQVLVHCEYGKSRSVLAGRAIEGFWKRQRLEASQLDPDRRNPRWARLLSEALKASLPTG